MSSTESAEPIDPKRYHKYASKRMDAGAHSPKILEELMAEGLEKEDAREVILDVRRVRSHQFHQTRRQVADSMLLKAGFRDIVLGAIILVVGVCGNGIMMCLAYAMAEGIGVGFWIGSALPVLYGMGLFARGIARVSGGDL